MVVKMKRRGSGALLHITSLPSPYDIGDFGPEAYRFIDFLSEARQSFWQILPLNPTNTVYGNSPYSSPSAYAGNPLLISPEVLMQEGLLSRQDADGFSNFPAGRVDYEGVTEYKNKLFRLAFRNFGKKRNNFEFEQFCRANSFWLEDYALFVSLKEHFQFAWNRWPEGVRDRHRDALKELSERCRERIDLEKFLQYVFFKQWFSLKNYSNSKNVQIIGDVTIYVGLDSCDVWVNPEIFKLDGNKQPQYVAGVPPDYFSDTGQLWGHPVYNWDALRETGYSWWINRIGHNSKIFDMFRLDHFRGFVAYWEIPAGDETALNGRWVEAPVEDFFDTLFKRFPNFSVIAEDLGVITPDVRETMSRLDFPGMKLLIFAFGDDFPNGAYLPHNYPKNCVVYTGTHDNNTVRGWWRSEANYEQRNRVFKYLGREVNEENVHRELIRLAMSSIANTVIFPMQDILGLGEEAKMNLPATSDGNWRWRLMPGQITPSVTERLREMTEIYGRG